MKRLIPIIIITVVSLTSCKVSNKQIIRQQHLEEGVESPTTVEELKDAIEKKLVSLNEWRRYALKTYETEDEEVLIYQSHEIIITSDECIIKPLIQESC